MRRPAARAERARRLSRADLARLRYAAGGEVDVARSLFGPQSVTWRVHREMTLLLGGGRALLLQIAHPLVAAGVAAHSRFEREPLQRLWRTLDLTLTTVFGTAGEALAAVRQVERVHAHVHGELADAVGPFAAGTRYDANDPALLFWVHATLVDSAVSAYEHLVAPLGAAERTALYSESQISARLFGIPQALIPPRWTAFHGYMRDMIGGPTLAVGPASRTIAAGLLSPPLPFGLRQLAASTRLFTIGLLPPAIRRRYGYVWTPTHARALRAVTTAIRAGLPVLPGIARTFPHARRALAAHAESPGAFSFRRGV
jgi:uncharacterized protein (DUF2236 family)